MSREALSFRKTSSETEAKELARLQVQDLKKGVTDLVSEGELVSKITRALLKGKPLRVKAGFDPSRPDLHLGHTVLMNKMRHFQELGHQVIFLIGDFTAMIGDPTGKNETRPALSKEECVENAKTYAKQVFKILDHEKTEVRYNASWFDLFKPADFIRLAGQYTVARMLERDDFSKRIKEQRPIAVHEFLYPLVQGYDSVALEADVELGGHDQRFNLLVGREIQKSYGMESQCVMTMPLLVGLDGVQKMSKSYDNYIGVEDTAKDIFGKTMRLSDDLMYSYYELLTDMSTAEVEALRAGVANNTLHPRDVKVRLAKTFVARFHSPAAADSAEEEFQRVFSNKGLPDIVEEVRMRPAEVGIQQLLVDLGMASSKGDARRLVEGRAVEIDQVKVTDPQMKLALMAGKSLVLKAGKKSFKRVVVES